MSFSLAVIAGALYGNGFQGVGIALAVVAMVGNYWSFLSK
jgi:hypothetical protein